MSSPGLESKSYMSCFEVRSTDRVAVVHVESTARESSVEDLNGVTTFCWYGAGSCRFVLDPRNGLVKRSLGFGSTPLRWHSSQVRCRSGSAASRCPP